VADKEYYFAGIHADTLYQGELCVPVGPGDTFTLSQDDLDNEANAHLFEGEFPAVAEVPEPEPAPAEEKATTTTKAKGGEK